VAHCDQSPPLHEVRVIITESILHSILEVDGDPFGVFWQVCVVHSVLHEEEVLVPVTLIVSILFIFEVVAGGKDGIIIFQAGLGVVANVEDWEEMLGLALHREHHCLVPRRDCKRHQLVYLLFISIPHPERNPIMQS